MIKKKGVTESTWEFASHNRVAKIFIVCLHYEISLFGIFHRFTNTIATKKTFLSLQRVFAGEVNLKRFIMSNSTLFVCRSIHQGDRRFSDISWGTQCPFMSPSALLCANSCDTLRIISLNYLRDQVLSFVHNCEHIRCSLLVEVEYKEKSES